MDPSRITDWLDILPVWLGFALRFPVSPCSALAPYASMKVVSKDLSLLAAAGIAVSYLLIVVAAPRSLASDRSPVVRAFRGVELTLLPPALILILVAFSVALHGSAKLYVFLFRDLTQWTAVEDTVNATLGFAAVYIPFAILLFIMLLRLPRSGKLPLTLSGLLILLAAGSLLAYLPLALSVVHGTTFWDALSKFCGAGGTASLLVFLVTYRRRDK